MDCFTIALFMLSQLYAMVDKSGLLEDQLSMRDEWRFAKMNNGEQSVTTLGMTMMQLLCADSFGTLLKVCTNICLT